MFFSKWHFLQEYFRWCFQSFHSLMIHADACARYDYKHAWYNLSNIYGFSVEFQDNYRMELFMPLSILCIPRAFKSVMKPGISFTNSVVYTIYRRNVWKVFSSVPSVSVLSCHRKWRTSLCSLNYVKKRSRKCFMGV